MHRNRALALLVALVLVLSLVAWLWPRPEPEVADAAKPGIPQPYLDHWGKVLSQHRRSPDEPRTTPKSLDEPAPETNVAMAELGPGEVRCQLIGFEGSTNGVLQAADGVRFVSTADGEVILPGITGDGAGMLEVTGFKPVPVQWQFRESEAFGHCLKPIELESVTRVIGTVTGPGVEDGLVDVSICGILMDVETDGTFGTVVEPGSCRIQASRQDGALFAPSKAIHVNVPEGETVEVELAVPDAIRGGIGARVEASEDGIRIVDVIPDGAAADRGLQAGDIVTEVDGELTADMELQDFIDWVGGASGTSVSVTFLRNGRTQTVELKRRPVN